MSWLDNDEVLLWLQKQKQFLSFLSCCPALPPPVSLDNLSFVWTQCQISILPRHNECKDIVPSGFAGLLRKKHWYVCYVCSTDFHSNYQCNLMLRLNKTGDSREICITSHKMDNIPWTFGILSNCLTYVGRRYWTSWAIWFIHNTIESTQ